jgi:transcriptional regulator with XRE-family HTH domain|nr:MAG TPA: terminase small subunit [Caudoviricetes sp.]
MRNYIISIKNALKIGAMEMAKYEKWLEQEGLLLIEGWARDGLTDEQIAGNMGVSRSTLNSWKDKYPDILDSLKKGKEIVDRQVENALLKRALGYEYEEIKEKYEFGELSERTITKKQVVPDTTAQIFWLKNRKPKDWRDKQERLDNTAEDNDMVKQFVEGMKQHGKAK